MSAAFDNGAMDKFLATLGNGNEQDPGGPRGLR